MDLRKLPPSMVLTLGLACGDGKSSDETTVESCLSTMPGMESTSLGPCLDIGPCLSEETSFPTTGESTSGSSGSSSADSTFGPCLSPEPPTGTDTGTGTGSGTDTGSGSDTDSATDTDATGTTGMMSDELPPSRAAALERVLERGTLPPDVAARLRGTLR
jgi:hypothetical protein